MWPFLKFNILNVVNSLSDETPNDELFGMHKSFIDPNEPPNVNPPVYKPP